MADRVRTACAVMSGGLERNLVVAALEELGFRVTAAEDPYEALALFATEPTDLVVLSLQGLTLGDCPLIRQLRHFSPPVRVLVLVPEGRRLDAVAFLEAGADAILSQTFLAAEFRMLVRSLLRPEAADPLTGLPNRAAYDQALPREILQASRHGTTLALAIFDIDKFGGHNRSLGYARADEVLQEVAARIQSIFRRSDLVARWGGEEFVVLLGTLPAAEKKARAEAREVFDRARTAVGGKGRPVLLRCGKTCAVTVSFGSALFPHDLPEPKRAAGEHMLPSECDGAGAALFDLANGYLQDAKRWGRDRGVDRDDEPPK